PAQAVEPAGTEERPTVQVGVLARRGTAQAFKQWGPTIDYLNEAVAGYRFELKPLDFGEVHQAVRDRQIHFFLANPVYFVDLEHNHGVRAIATLLNRRLDQVTAEFGGVIFCRADRKDIQHLDDIKKKRFMAVDPLSFGGWTAGKYHLFTKGIVTERDCASMDFGGTHDAVVYAVRDGKVDAGTVRTDTLERMTQEGKIRLEDFRILDPQKTPSPFPFQLSTALYPEWPMASLPHVDAALIKQVTVALLQMKPDSAAARAATAEGWTAALNYQPVHDCLRELRMPPYTDYGKVTWQQALRKQWPLVAGLLLILVLALVFSFRLKGLNRQLAGTLDRLDDELAQRREAEAALSNFKQTLDQVHDCVFMFDAETLRFIYANQGAVQQIGYSPKELETMTPVDVKPRFTDDSFRQMLAPLMHGDKDATTFITDYRRKDGQLVPVEVMLQYVKPDDTGRFVAVVRDINERLKAEKEKEKLQAQLLQSQKLESVGRLASGIAHEINTPIQFISSNVDFLNDSFQSLAKVVEELRLALKGAETADLTSLAPTRTALEEADWDYLAGEVPLAIQQSKNGLERVSSIVLAMKEFSHPGAKEKIPASLNRIVETTVTVARNEWKYVAEVTTELAPDLPMVPCLTDEMGQVILNMLVNAAHAIGAKLGANPEGAKGSIHISTKALTDGVELRLSDSGTGIPQAIRDRIFEPFFTTKEVGRGTGQGLAICHDVIVEKHGGTLAVESEEGVGSTFVITLPLQQPAAEATA
ncbi:MAG: hypothetical protein BWK76_07260, partial [Desulfobulbaceae bacterium A2]